MYLKTTGVDLRRPFVDSLLELEEENPGKIVFIVMDVGFSFLEPIKQKLGNRFLNMGVTEQSSMIIAAAMALSGLRPVIYSMIPFVTFRVHEMIRNAVCMHKAPVCIAGVKGSEKYKFLGFSHNVLRENEEIDFLEKLPGMKCYLPKSEEETQKAVKKIFLENNPAYIRL